MGKKNKTDAETAVGKNLFWCYYCDARANDEYKLVQHQRAKHFVCQLCDASAYGKNCLTLSGLISHVRKSHRKELDKVPGAVHGRDSVKVEVSAMNGIPRNALDAFLETIAEEKKAADVEAKKASEDGKAETYVHDEPTDAASTPAASLDTIDAPVEVSFEPPPLPPEPPEPPPEPPVAPLPPPEPPAAAIPFEDSLEQESSKKHIESKSADASTSTVPAKSAAKACKASEESRGHKRGRGDSRDSSRHSRNVRRGEAQHHRRSRGRSHRRQRSRSRGDSRDGRHSGRRRSKRRSPRRSPSNRSNHSDPSPPKKQVVPESDGRQRRSKWDATQPTTPVVSVAPNSLPTNQEQELKQSMCMAFTEGLCSKGTTCPFAHSIRELMPGGYKPRLCPSFGITRCPRANTCVYAHQRHELPPAFKTIICQNYSTGYCRKAQICTYAHGEPELDWFTKFMNIHVPGYPTPAEIAEKNAALLATPRQAIAAVPAVVEPTAALADTVMAAAQNELRQGAAVAVQPGGGNLPKTQPPVDKDGVSHSHRSELNVKATAMAPLEATDAAIASLFPSLQPTHSSQLPVVGTGPKPPESLHFAGLATTIAQASSQASAQTTTRTPSAVLQPNAPMAAPGCCAPSVPTSIGPLSSSADTHTFSPASAMAASGLPSGPQEASAAAKINKPCPKYAMGGCMIGDACPFLH